MLHTIKQTTLAICFQAVKLIFFFFHIFSLMVGVGDFWLALRSYLLFSSQSFIMYIPSFFFYFLFLAV